MDDNTNEIDFFLGDQISAIYGGKRRTGKLVSFGSTGWCTVECAPFELWGMTRTGFALSPTDRGSMRLVTRGQMENESVKCHPVEIGGAYLA